MNDIQIFLIGLGKVIWNFKFQLLYLIFGLAFLGRCERNEKKRMEEAVERDKLRRAHHEEHIAGRN